ncbi:hypothetical protein [Calothrix sp. NIES-2098]|uniref:hypothetical protein n=1 Tax=Calothrix sp. NIES-2098 TaxID=1954171 RepID=UPI000B601FF8|nr:hypothetical protein NIES2098_73350 [Calothrix sp. NIES-2098]
MTTSPEGLHQEGDHNDLAHQSTQNKTWQDALDPQLTWRLRRPLVQPGAIGSRLARAVLSRTQRVSNRLPLLTKLIQPWIHNIGYFHFQPSPNDHILRLPDFDSTSDSPDIAAAFNSQSPANNAISDQADHHNTTEMSPSLEVTKFTLLAQARHQVGYHSQPLSSLAKSTDDTSSRDNPQQNISLPTDAITISKPTLTSGQPILHRAASNSIPSSQPHLLDVNAQLYQRLQRPQLQPRLVSIQLARTVQSRIQHLSDRLPLLKELDQHQPHQEDLQVHKKSNDEIQRLPDFDSGKDLPELTVSEDSQAIANANVARFSRDNPQQNISLPTDAITISKPTLTSGQPILHRAASNSIPSSQPHLLDVNAQLYQRLQRPQLQPRLVSIQLARTVQSRIQHLSDRLPLLKELDQHQPHQEDLQVHKKSNDEIQRLPDFDSGKDLPELTVSEDSQAIANANVARFSRDNPQQNISLPTDAIATSRPILTLGKQIVHRVGSSSITSSQPHLLDVNAQLYQRLQRPQLQPRLASIQLARTVQSRIQRLSNRLQLLTELTQHQSGVQHLQTNQKNHHEIQRLLDFNSNNVLPALTALPNSPQVRYINQTSQPTQRIFENTLSRSSYTHDFLVDKSLAPDATTSIDQPTRQDPEKNTSSFSPSVIKNSELAANTAQTTSKLDLENQLQHQLLRPIVQPGVLSFKLAHVVQSQIQRLSDRLPLLKELDQHQPHQEDLQVHKKSNDEIQRLPDFDSRVNPPKLAEWSTSNAETFLAQQVHHINQTSKPSGSATSRSSKANKPTIVQGKAKHQVTHEMFVRVDSRANLPSASVVRSKRNGTTTIPAQKIKQFIHQPKTSFPSSVKTQSNGIASSSTPMTAKEQIAQISKFNSTPNFQLHSSEQQRQQRLQHPLVQSSIIGSQLVRTIQTRKQQLSNHQPLLAKLFQRQHSRYHNQTQSDPRVDVQRSLQEFRHPSDLKVLATENTLTTNPSKFELVNRSQPNEQPKATVSPLARVISARQTRSNPTQQNLQPVKSITVSRSKSSVFSSHADIYSQISATPVTAISHRTDHVLEPQSSAPIQRIMIKTNENSQKIQLSSVRPLVKEIRRKKLLNSPMPLVLSSSSAFDRSGVKLQPTNNSVMSGTHNSFTNSHQESAIIPSNSSQINDTQSHTNNQNNSARTRERDRENAIDVDDLADRVMRKVMRQLAIESERRGGWQWP